MDEAKIVTTSDAKCTSRADADSSMFLFISSGATYDFSYILSLVHFVINLTLYNIGDGERGGGGWECGRGRGERGVS